MFCQSYIDLQEILDSPQSNYKVPIISLAIEKLSAKEQKQLEMGLESRFVEKNKHSKKRLAAKFESLLHRASDCVHHQSTENFHEFLRAYIDIFAKNIYATKDFTYSILKNTIKNDKFVVLSGDRDSCVVIMQWDKMM